MKKNLNAEIKPSKPRLEKVRLSDLVPHPDQEKFFSDYTVDDYEALKKDIAAHGLKVPIEVLPRGNAADLPGGTLVSGHNRRKILLELGHTIAEVLMRYDLINATQPEIAKCFLTDNLARRHQSPLSKARAAVALFLNEKQQQGRRVSGDPLQNGELREQIGRIVGMSGRNLQRYLNILSAMIEVQRAFEKGDIRLVDAAKVAGLNKKQQEQFAARLRDGEDAKAVYNSFFPPKDGRHVKPADAVASFARSLEKGHDDLADRVKQASPGLIRKYEKPLRKGRKLIKELLEKLATEE